MAAAPAEYRQQKEVNELVICPICLEQLEDPRDLSCKHTFCLKCLTLSQLSEEMKSCPFCRSNTVPPASQLAGLPKNKFVNDLVQFLKKEKTHKKMRSRKPKPEPMHVECDDDYLRYLEQHRNFSPTRAVHEPRANRTNEPVVNRHILRAQRRIVRPPQQTAPNQNAEINTAFDMVPDGFEITEDGFVMHPDVLLYNN